MQSLSVIDTYTRECLAFGGGYELWHEPSDRRDSSMADMEVHEHVVIDGETRQLKNSLIHHNVESLSRYFQKNNEYSNWEAKV